eukprot:4256837-Amphidinium_carterae.1
MDMRHVSPPLCYDGDILDLQVIIMSRLCLARTTHSSKKHAEGHARVSVPKLKGLASKRSKFELHTIATQKTNSRTGNYNLQVHVLKIPELQRDALMSNKCILGQSRSKHNEFLCVRLRAHQTGSISGGFFQSKALTAVFVGFCEVVKDLTRVTSLHLQLRTKVHEKMSEGNDFFVGGKKTHMICKEEQQISNKLLT